MNLKKMNKKIKPTPPLSSIIREGTIGDCIKCGSTTIKRFYFFGIVIGCIQPECENYYKLKKIPNVNNNK